MTTPLPTLLALLTGTCLWLLLAVAAGAVSAVVEWLIGRWR